jgi:hypothetical protein
MTTKELLIQEIETLPPELFTEALKLIRSIKIRTYATGTLRSLFNSILVLFKLISKISPSYNC